MERIEAIGYVKADNGVISLGVRVRDDDTPGAPTRLGHLYVCDQYPPHEVGPAGGIVEFHPVDDQDYFQPVHAQPGGEL